MTRFLTHLVFLALALPGFLIAEDILPPAYLEMDTDKNGSVSEAEYVAYFAARARSEFAKLDSDSDGNLELLEVQPVKPVVQTKKVSSEQNFLERLIIGDGTERRGSTYKPSKPRKGF